MGIVFHSNTLGGTASNVVPANIKCQDHHRLLRLIFRQPLIYLVPDLFSKVNIGMFRLCHNDDLNVFPRADRFHNILHTRRTEEYILIRGKPSNGN